MRRRRLGLLGGTFDPIHVGHLDLAHAAHAALGLDRIVLMPSHTPPHRPRPHATSFHRFAMVALAVSGDPRLVVSDDELHQEAPSYTVDTLSRFQSSGFARHELFFVIGADAFADITTWRGYPLLLDTANFAVVSRAGRAAGSLRATLPELAGRMSEQAEPIDRRGDTSIFLIDAVTRDVSASAIRARLAAGQSVEEMVDSRVRQHIEQHALYGSASPDSLSSLDQNTTQAGTLHDKD